MNTLACYQVTKNFVPHLVSAAVQSTLTRAIIQFQTLDDDKDADTGWTARLIDASGSTTYGVYSTDALHSCAVNFTMTRSWELMTCAARNNFILMAIWQHT